MPSVAGRVQEAPSVGGLDLAKICAGGYCEDADYPAATSKEEFCRKAADPSYFKALLYDPHNKLGFTNYGGLMNGGVCWWHSRFQRSATYLTVFRPDLPKPNRSQVLRIIKNIVSNGAVSEVPGYRNLREFSYDWEREIEGYLQAWQAREGIVGMGWVRGLLGTYDTDPARLRRILDRIYGEVEGKGNITYVKLQIPGVDAHALLVVNMKRTADGYELHVVDSNAPGGIGVYLYREGDRHFEAYGQSIPYLEEVGAMRKASGTIRDYCAPASKRTTARDSSEELSAE